VEVVRFASSKIVALAKPYDMSDRVIRGYWYTREPWTKGRHLLILFTPVLTGSGSTGCKSLSAFRHPVESVSIVNGWRQVTSDWIATFSIRYPSWCIAKVSVCKIGVSGPGPAI